MALVWGDCIDRILMVMTSLPMFSLGLTALTCLVPLPSRALKPFKPLAGPRLCDPDSSASWSNCKIFVFPPVTQISFSFPSSSSCSSSSCSNAAAQGSHPPHSQADTAAPRHSTAQRSLSQSHRGSHRGSHRYARG